MTTSKKTTKKSQKKSAKRTNKSSKRLTKERLEVLQAECREDIRQKKKIDFEKQLQVVKDFCNKTESTIYEIAQDYFEINGIKDATVLSINTIGLVADYIVGDEQTGRSGKIVFRPYEVANPDVFKENAETVRRIKEEENYDQQIKNVAKVDLNRIKQISEKGTVYPIEKEEEITRQYNSDEELEDALRLIQKNKDNPK
jgi:hypothetical protein